MARYIVSLMLVTSAMAQSGGVLEVVQTSDKITLTFADKLLEEQDLKVQRALMENMNFYWLKRPIYVGDLIYRV